MIPLMSITRNFFMGREPARAPARSRRFDIERGQRRSRATRWRKIGIDVRDPTQAVGTLSGGERQCVAIARAVYFGAKVLILDEPTSALGVKQASVVLRYVAQARAAGPGRDLHHPQRPPRLSGRRQVHRAQPRPHARHLRQGRDHARGSCSNMMAGGKELEELGAELEEFSPLRRRQGQRRRLALRGGRSRRARHGRGAQALEPVMDQGQVSGAPEHEAGEGDEVEAGQRLGQALVVADEPAAAGRPGEGTLDHPPARQQDEAPLRLGRP